MSWRFTEERWWALCDRLGILQNERSFDCILRPYSEPSRSYHNVDHIDDCLGQFDRCCHLASHPNELEFALWLHDIVYDTRSTDNEERSAEFAASMLRNAACGRGALDRVLANIEATSHRQPGCQADEQLIADIDLSILGRPAVEYDDFEQRIREEYQGVPWPVYREKRTEILQSFLRRETTYATDWFASRFESSARENLERAIGQLNRAN